jgi:hypothetical protein
LKHGHLIIRKIWHVEEFTTAESEEKEAKGN